MKLCVASSYTLSRKQLDSIGVVVSVLRIYWTRDELVDAAVCDTYGVYLQSTKFRMRLGGFDLLIEVYSHSGHPISHHTSDS